MAKLRFERGWSQEVLAARLQCQGEDISRQVLANMESGRTQVADELLPALQKVFSVPLVMLFPKSVQELDQKFAERVNIKPVNKISPRRRGNKS